jgi:hydroxymethylpyrimidine kinase/phosphomethylpyrimidine kinase
MVSTSGSQLLPQEAVRELRELLLPMTTVLTPNVPEAKLLLSSSGKPVHDPGNVEDLIEIAKAVQSLGPKYVLVKGGHLPFRKDGTVASRAEDRDLMVDILYGEDRVTRFESTYQNSKNTHGTGCSLACESDALSRGKSSNGSSCDCVESRQWTECDASREEGLQIC